MSFHPAGALSRDSNYLFPEKTEFSSPEVGDCNSTCPPSFSHDLKFNHLAVADVAVAEAVSDYS